jgi:hypothetical protein
MTPPLPRLALRVSIALLALAALIGIAAMAADLGLRLGGLWSGGYYDDPGAEAHAVFVSIATFARSLAFVAVGAIAALAVLQPRSIRRPLMWLWLTLPAVLGVLTLAISLHGLWPIANPTGVHPICHEHMGHTCPSHPLLPEAWVRYQLQWSVALLTVMPSLLVVFLAQVIGTAVRLCLRAFRWLRSRASAHACS